MRVSLAMLSLPLLSLAACGGGGVNTIGSLSPPSEPTPGQTFLDVSGETAFNAVGSMHSVQYDETTGAVLYQGNASTVAAPSGTITYNPRDGIFNIQFSDSKAGITRNVRFQDPAHRTDGNPVVAPPAEVPEYDGFNYLEALDGNSPTTFFYQRPGKTTSYVSLAGFVHTETIPDPNNPTKEIPTLSEHGVMVFGAQTPVLQVPTEGSGHFDGQFLATLVDTSSFDTGGSESIFQWMNGTSSIDVDFAKSTVKLGLSGVVGPTYIDNTPIDDAKLHVPTGATFTASGEASITGTAGTFAGKFTSASFTAGGTNIPIDFTSVNPANSTAGASSIDGTFYGPNAKEIGGNFRIVGGVPDERVDILGAFTGAKK